MTAGYSEGLFRIDPGAVVSSRVAPAGAGKTFRGYDHQQQFLLPPSLDDWLDEDDEARFVSEVVDDVLDLSGVYASYESAAGAPPYDPRMMLKLLLFAYSTGVTSSREVERRCKRDIGFRWLSGNQGGYQMVCVRGEVHLEGEHYGDHGYQCGARGASPAAEGAR